MVPHINNGTVINMLTGNTSQNMQGIGFFASQPAPHINIGVPAGGGLHPHPNMMGIDPRSSPDCRHLFKDSSADNLIPKLESISIQDGQNDPQNQPGAQYIHHPCPQKTHAGQLPLSGMATDLCRLPSSNLPLMNPEHWSPPEPRMPTRGFKTRPLTKRTAGTSFPR